MLILTIRTDKPEAEIGLFDDEKRLAYTTWQAHRELAETIHQKIKELLASKQKTLEDIEGVVAFKGPGSFTGLRIGISVANALADSLRVPVIGETGEGWIETALKRLNEAQDDHLVLPEYGAPPRITKQKR